MLEWKSISTNNLYNFHWINELFGHSKIQKKNWVGLATQFFLFKRLNNKTIPLKTLTKMWLAELAAMAG